MKLPESFVSQMHVLLDENYPAYEDSFRVLPAKGLRVNERRCDAENFSRLWKAHTGMELQPVPWAHDGFFADETAPFSSHPYYQAGLFYLQDPAAMAPAENLTVSDGDRVLDLCAAPGGKATELAAKLGPHSVLYANDSSASRAKILRKNLELQGAAQVYVTAETPEHLAEVFPAYFDKILVDAPCSGEAMFRVQPEMVRHWMEAGPEAYAPVQRQILEMAWRMLKPGGQMLYSTCSFSPLEDELQVLDLMLRHRDLTLRPLPHPCSAFAHLTREKLLCFAKGSLREHILQLPDARVDSALAASSARLYPHRMRVSGQFLILLEKAGPDVDQPVSRTACASRASARLSASGSATDAAGISTDKEKPRDPVCGRSRKKAKQKGSTRRETRRAERAPAAGGSGNAGAYEKDGERYRLPEGTYPKPGLRYLMTGLHLGTETRGRFAPSQSYAMTLSEAAWQDCLNLRAEDPRVLRYLRGETLLLEEAELRASDCETLVCVDGYPLGFGKRNGAMLKNRRSPLWRIR